MHFTGRRTRQENNKQSFFGGKQTQSQKNNSAKNSRPVAGKSLGLSSHCDAAAYRLPRYTTRVCSTDTGINNPRMQGGEKCKYDLFSLILMKCARVDLLNHYRKLCVGFMLFSQNLAS